MFTHFQRFFTPLETNPKAKPIHPRNPPGKSFPTVGSASSLLLRIPDFLYVTLAPQFPAETPKPDNYAENSSASYRNAHAVHAEFGTIIYIPLEREFKELSRHV
jgi:hypothetical protein